MTLQQTFNHLFLNYETVSPKDVWQLDRTHKQEIWQNVKELNELIQTYHDLNTQNMTQINIVWQALYSPFTVVLYKRSMNQPLQFVIKCDTDMEKSELEQVINKIKERVERVEVE